MKITEARKKYKKQWLLFKYTDQSHKVGKVLCHNKSRDVIHQKVMALPKPIRDIYITYTGPLIPKGWGTLLCSK